MPITFACATSHAPGITAWAEAAPAPQKDAIYGGFERLRGELDASGTEALIVLTSEHWANFFLDHIGAFCVGRAEHYSGPIEPWLKIAKTTIKGDPTLAAEIVETAYDEGVEPSFAYELEFDHGTMLPLHFLNPSMERPVVPIFFNTLAVPQPTPRRALAFGRIIGEVARRSPRRIGIVATGGLSHDPGERNHGTIDSDFDHRFMAAMAQGNCETLGAYRREELAAAGAGAFELLSWIALAGALSGTNGGGKGEVVLYEAVKPWATGVGMMRFPQAIAA
jgi:aromatic ring-opening dioxygenase catalytic subunit (LigB family)